MRTNPMEGHLSCQQLIWSGELLDGLSIQRRDVCGYG